MTLILYAIPFFLITVFAESWVLARDKARRFRGVKPKDSLASISMGLGYLLIELALKVLPFGLLALLYPLRIFDLRAVWWSWVLLFIAEDFCYYWFHRTHHEVRMLWAAHINHHSSTYYNLSTALRQSWTTSFTGAIFWAPLPLLGFPLEMIAVQKAISLLYQYWLHTELIGKMGPFEWVFNTPSHHRVHHGRNPLYLDRNYGGILIVWDRLFGSFEPERESVDYGITKNIDTYNLVRIAYHEWLQMFRDVLSARTWRGRIGYMLRAPGWNEEGTGMTAERQRAEAGY
ncbi:MAG: sterol desaturase family protein [Polyangiales bacterium]